MSHKLPALHELPTDDLLSHEDLLIALDQLDQTVEVMTALIKRIKREIAQSRQNLAEQEAIPQVDLETGGSLH